MKLIIGKITIDDFIELNGSYFKEIRFPKAKITIHISHDNIVHMHSVFDYFYPSLFYTCTLNDFCFHDMYIAFKAYHVEHCHWMMDYFLPEKLKILF
jgi:hypothetical protein